MPIPSDDPGAVSNIQPRELPPLLEAIMAAVQEVDAAASHDDVILGVPTGLTELDGLTNGLRPGQMTVVVAGPGTGKSTLALTFARSASIGNGHPSIFFTLEMGKSEIAMRLLSAECEIPLQSMRDGTLESREWHKLAITMARIAEAPLYIDDSPTVTAAEIHATCRQLKQRAGLKLVLVDSVQLMTSGTPRESRQQEVEGFARALRLLAEELQVAVVVVSQQGQGTGQRTDKKSDSSDLRESESIERHADMVIRLRHDGAHEEDTCTGHAGLIVAKNRHGRTATIDVDFQGSYSRFVDVAPGASVAGGRRSVD